MYVRTYACIEDSQLVCMYIYIYTYYPHILNICMHTCVYTCTVYIIYAYIYIYKYPHTLTFIHVYVPLNVYLNEYLNACTDPPQDRGSAQIDLFESSIHRNFGHSK